MGNHTIEKIGGTSMSRFGEVMNNVIIGSRKGRQEDRGTRRIRLHCERQQELAGSLGKSPHENA